ncbi:MAG: family efflux transporter [Chitinophagaceae bacterium]|nr:family efflux transporter [Chitinophagaceae bacterium]
MLGPGTHTDYRLSTNYRQILKIALPISASMLVPQINFITNNIFLGGLGQQALAVAGITGVYYLVFAVIGQGLNNGLQALISRKAGENKIDEIGNLFSQGIRVSMCLAAIGIAVTWLLAPLILHSSLKSDTTVHVAVDFLRIRICGLPFLYVYQMRNALLVGTNNSRLLVIGTLAETVTNILLDYGLIYGHFGLPALGFKGAAIASVIAEVAGLIVIFAVMHFSGLSRRLKLFHNFYFNKKVTLQILNISSPLVLQYALSIISWEFFYILIEHHGEQALAISNAMRNIFGFFGCFTWAFAATANTMVSNVLGQRKEDLVIPLIHKLVRLSLGFGLTIAILLNIFPALFLSIYNQDTAFTIAAIPVVRIVSSALVLMSFSTVWLNSVVGTGNSKWNLFTETVAIILYCVYNFFVLEYLRLPITYGWASEWIYWTVMFILSFWYMKSGRWKKIENRRSKV